MDPQLEQSRDHLEYRWRHYRLLRENIIVNEGSLAEFAQVGATGKQWEGHCRDTTGGIRWQAMFFSQGYLRGYFTYCKYQPELLIKYYKSK